MKTINKHTLGSVVNEVVDAFIGTARFSMDTLARMSWPALLLSCLVIAVIATVLPLAIMLFLLFLAAKIIVAAFFVKGAAQKESPHEDGGPAL